MTSQISELHVRGRLHYTGWLNTPWMLMVENGDTIDLWPAVHEFFVSLDGRHAEHHLATDAYTLMANGDSEFTFHYDPEECAVLQKNIGFGFVNVNAYFGDALVWLSGRLIEVEIADNQLRVAADKSEDVFGVSLMENSNVGEIPEGTEETVCKMGHGAECCIFLSANADGFRCQKFSGPMARVLLGRLVKQDIRARRIGNCAMLGKR